jgi:glycosyltransferase involved in cell wall biosynthesis
MEYPLVSFIIGVYNTKKKDELVRSVDSILKQSYPNLEVVFCDDASNNGIYEFLVKQYGGNSKVKILRNNKNCGLGRSLNNCLSVANGKYIARQDDDDYIDSTKIEKQIDFLENNPDYSFVSTGVTKFDENGIWDSFLTKEMPQKRDFRFHSQHVHAATVFTKECLLAVNGYRISPETRRIEDYDLFMRLYAEGYKGYNIQECLYYYNFPRGNARKISYKNKIMEARVRYKGFKALGLPIIDYVFVLRPLIAGLLSENLKQKIKTMMRR